MASRARRRRSESGDAAAPTSTDDGWLRLEPPALAAQLLRVGTRLKREFEHLRVTRRTAKVVGCGYRTGWVITLPAGRGGRPLLLDRSAPVHVLMVGVSPEMLERYVYSVAAELLR